MTSVFNGPRPDVVIIGSGMGGATYAAALAATERQVLILERGERLQPSSADRDAQAIFRDGVFRSCETWLDGAGKPFYPGNYAMVGGNSKLYGAALIRYRAQDFSARQHVGGTTPDWPLSYDELEPFYAEAEQLYRVHGNSLSDDPTEPRRSTDYAFGAVPHEPDIARLKAQLEAVGAHPTSIPLGVDLDAWLGVAQTPWDAFPNSGGGKMDAETCALNQALKSPNVRLATGCKVVRLVEGADGRVDHAVVESDGRPLEVRADHFVLAAGAVQSAALLLASRCEQRPSGLANSSDQVGRNFMNHNASALMALHPFRRNRAVYQKTLMLNDFYDDGPDGQGPLGNVQMLGKISGDILSANAPGLGPFAGWIARRSFDFYAMSEDLPDPDSRITLHDGQIRLDWRRTNWEAHEGLVAALKALLRRAGFPIVLSRAFDHRTPSHQCGTARMGDDPRSSVVNPWGQSHDHPNLIISDASVFVTSAAVNPALTIAALSLRSAQALAQGKMTV